MLKWSKTGKSSWRFNKPNRIHTREKHRRLDRLKMTSEKAGLLHAGSQDRKETHSQFEISCCNDRGTQSRR
jgi:hypothetical protein